MGRTFDRARTATFSKPYMRYGKLLMIRAADRDKYRSLADLDKPELKIAYNKGGLNDRFANTEFKHATPAGYPSNELATADLLAGLPFVADVDLAGGIVADQHGGQPRPDASLLDELGHAAGQLGLHGLG